MVLKMSVDAVVQDSTEAKDARTASVRQCPYGTSNISRHEELIGFYAQLHNQLPGVVVFFLPS